MYFVCYPTNSLELPTPGWNVWRVESDPHGTSYKILEIIIGGKRRASATHVSVVDSRFLVEGERDVVKVILGGYDV